FIGGAPVVGKPYLIYAKATVVDLGDVLRLESESVFLYLDPLDDLPAEHLIARLHVREIQIREHVRKKGQERVAHAVPEIDHPMGAPAGESGAHHDICLAVPQGSQQVWKLQRVVLEVRVLYGDE